jgi:hypothetical protein
VIVESRRSITEAATTTAKPSHVVRERERATALGREGVKAVVDMADTLSANAVIF